MAKGKISKRLIKQLNRELAAMRALNLGKGTINPKYLKKGDYKNLIRKALGQHPQRTKTGLVRKADLNRVTENALIELKWKQRELPNIQKRLRSYKKKKFNKKLKQLKKAGVLTYEGWWGV